MCGDDMLCLELPNGVQRLRLDGRWLIDSQSRERFKVAQAIIVVITSQLVNDITQQVGR